MNQFSRFSVCRSVLRRNPFARCSSKPMTSSLPSSISNNQTSSSNLISKFHHHTLNHPPQNFSNHFRKFSGEAAGDANFSDDYLKQEISKVDEAILDARNNLESRALSPHDAVKIPVQKYKALKEKFGLDNGDLPHHLQRFEKEIERLDESFQKIVAYRNYALVGGELGDAFEDWYSLDKEMSEVYEPMLDAWDDIELGTLPPLDAVKITKEKYKAFMEKILDENGDLLHHLRRFEKEIGLLKESVHKVVTFAKFVDGGGELRAVFKDWYRSVGRFEELSSESEDETAQDQIAMPVGDAVEVSAPLHRITNQ